METIYLPCLTMIHLLAMLYQFLFYCGYHSSYQLFENDPNKRGDDYFHYYVCKYMIFYHVFYDL